MESETLALISKQKLLILTVKIAFQFFLNRLLFLIKTSPSLNPQFPNELPESLRQQFTDFHNTLPFKILTHAVFRK